MYSRISGTHALSPWPKANTQQMPPSFGRKMAPTDVFLNVYDLSTANDMLYNVGLGLHHSGVEISGVEYSFASGAGVFESTPQQAPNAKFRTQIHMGSIVGKEKLQDALATLRNSDFGPDDYHLVRNNCNHFANRLLWLLLNKTIPSHINRLADIGSCCICLLPRQLLEQAPVGDTTAGNNSSVGGGLHSASSSTPQVQAFSGGGARLGGGSSTTEETTGLMSAWRRSGGGKNGTNNDDLTDRREKARLAALARLERQNSSPPGGT